MDACRVQREVGNYQKWRRDLSHSKRAVPIPLAVIAFGAGIVLAFGSRTAAQTSELRVLISDGMKPSLEALAPKLEQGTGRKLATEFNTSKILRDRILGGEPFDAAILSTDVIDELVQKGKISAASRTDISRTGMGVGVQAGAPKPDVSTPEALKQVILSAKHISFNPTGASAIHLHDMLTRMEIEDQVKPKFLPDPEPGNAQRAVADGKSDLVITLIPEIKFFPGVELAGPIPDVYQSYISFSAGVASNAHDPAAAKKLIDAIKGPAGAEAIKAKAMEPR
jgi:molybdate transport system substrate-binding protein